jgi:hypothetical protein
VGVPMKSIAQASLREEIAKEMGTL